MCRMGATCTSLPGPTPSPCPDWLAPRSSLLEQAHPETSLERTATGVRDAKHARLRGSLDPAELQEPRRERHAEWSGEMVAPLAPVETRAAEEAPAATQRFDVDPQVAEHRVRILGKQEGPVFQRDCALSDQGLGDPHPKSPCPVVLMSTCNPDGTPNLAPLSAVWALGWTVVLGPTRQGQTLTNLQRTGECVLNLPSEDLRSSTISATISASAGSWGARSARRRLIRPAEPLARGPSV